MINNHTIPQLDMECTHLYVGYIWVYMGYTQVTISWGFPKKTSIWDDDPHIMHVQQGCITSHTGPALLLGATSWRTGAAACAWELKARYGVELRGTVGYGWHGNWYCWQQISTKLGISGIEERARILNIIVDMKMSTKVFKEHALFELVKCLCKTLHVRNGSNWWIINLVFLSKNLQMTGLKMHLKATGHWGLYVPGSLTCQLAVQLNYLALQTYANQGGHLTGSLRGWSSTSIFFDLRHGLKLWMSVNCQDP